MILAIDPSSTCTGYAVLAGLEPGALIDAGRLRASRSWSASAVEEPPGLGLRRRALLPYGRVDEICDDISTLLEERKASLRGVIIEVPSGRIGTGGRRGARGSLAIYGMAAGAIWRHIWTHLCRPRAVMLVTEREWIRDVPAKADRRAWVAAMYPTYRPENDPGSDVADAILLGRWWIRSAGSGVVPRW